MSANFFLRKWFYDIDKFTLFFPLSLVFLCLLLSLTISPAMAHRINISNYHFTIHQVIFCVAGIAIMLFLSMCSKNTILYFSSVGYLFCIFLLCLVLFTGSSIKGSHRWIKLGLFSIQPSEIMKPFFIVINAHLLSVSKTDKFLPILSVSIFGFLILLFILQPDFGSAIIYSLVWLVQIFLGNTQIRILFRVFTPAIIILGITGFLFFPHVHYRIINFFTLRGGHEQYQTRKAIESIYNGGFFGKGLGEGEVKYQLPDAHTDYIFSVICEEFGSIFAICLILYFLLFTYRHLASNIMSEMYKIRVIYGIILLFISQSCIHIAVNINIFPSKGMTLPFISYGGSSMLANSIMFGFLLAFTRKSYEYKTPYKVFEDAYRKRRK